MSPTLSVIIITKNAASQIRTCLDSVTFADEIIVLDSGSEDGTVDICKEYTSHVYSTDWPGFGAQKNRALAKATGDWVLSLDADEYLSDALAADIRQVIQSPDAREGYTMRRRTNFCGHYIRYGDWSRDDCLRLFKRGKASFTEVAVHESVVLSSLPGKLQGLLMHDSYLTLDSMLSKMNHYSTLRATILHKKAKHASVPRALLHATWRFIRGYMIRFGFLDGRAGFMLALTTAHATFYCYAKLMYLNDNTSLIEPS